MITISLSSARIKKSEFLSAHLVLFTKICIFVLFIKRNQIIFRFLFKIFSIINLETVLFSDFANSLILLISSGFPAIEIVL